MANYSAIKLWVYGAPGGSVLDIYTQSTDEGANGPAYRFTAPAGVWTEISVPLSSIGSPSQIARINVQDGSGAVQAAFYVDEVELMRK